MTLHQPNDIIAQRYRIVALLGKGGMGITYEAEDLINYQRVALKVVSLREAKDWKILELFEREARILANLSHPQIPKYLNYFYIDTKQDRRFYLIRELVWGNSLATWVKKGWHPTEVQVKQVAIQVLEILSYLHQLTPSIIHRDIKPENVILRPDGKIFLVDFGAVQDIYRHTMSFSGTFVGTLGYMSPEQLRGKAYCASDLYSLGGTLLYLLTHRYPDELPQKRMKIDFRSCVKISPKFADWLEVILEPMWEDRFQSATEALNVLSNKSEIISPASYLVKNSHKKPLSSKVNLQKTPISLIINIPPGSISCAIFFLIFTIVIFAFMLIDLLTVLSIVEGVDINLLLFNFFMALMISPFVFFVWETGYKTQIKIYRKNILIHRKLWVFSHKIIGKTADIMGIDYEENFNGRENIVFYLFEGRKKHKFGFYLGRREKEWLVAEIGDFLEHLRFQESLEEERKKLLD